MPVNEEEIDESEDAQGNGADSDDEIEAVFEHPLPPESKTPRHSERGVLMRYITLPLYRRRSGTGRSRRSWRTRRECRTSFRSDPKAGACRRHDNESRRRYLTLGC